MENRELYDLVVIGGGAAGFYGAVQATEMMPGIRVVILEKSNKLLSKVRISGGGRCNVTHNCREPAKLSKHYPRGEKLLKRLFRHYGVPDTIGWFERNGVPLKVEADGRMFPVTDNSETIIACLMQRALAAGTSIKAGEAVTAITKTAGEFTVSCHSGHSFRSQTVLVATGGNASPRFYDWITATDHTVASPIPSLFTFNDVEKLFADLMGVSVPGAEVRIAGQNFSQTGPVLITHWGLSGPAVIKLSAWAAAHLHAVGYDFTALVSWLGKVKEEEVRAFLEAQRHTRGKQKVIANPRYALPQRLWVRLCELAGVEPQLIWSELPRRNLNRLVEFLIRCPFRIKGKTTFKEEFVTCGGVDLAQVNEVTMESNRMRGLYFAGEVLNMDGETGGFNFQAAWTTAFIAARAITGALITAKGDRYPKVR